MIVNKPRVSPAIARLYYGLTAFLGVFLTFILVFVVYPEGSTFGTVVMGLTIVLVGFIFSNLISSLHNTQYILSDMDILIKTTFIIGGPKRVYLNEIMSIEATRIPWGIRLFGASLHGGYYYFPEIGYANVAMTNFSDGLLITTTRSRYIITPRDPLNFKEQIEDRMNKIQGVISKPV
ncbi:MAG: PH domain-containing protein [Candidatus Bathyarchaeota archaeon]|nr:PH domain-containing protein [Candidatus Bathyarchaeota archaeon]